MQYNDRTAIIVRNIGEFFLRNIEDQTTQLSQHVKYLDVYLNPKLRFQLHRREMQKLISSLLVMQKCNW